MFIKYTIIMTIYSFRPENTVFLPKIVFKRQNLVPKMEV